MKLKIRVLLVGAVIVLMSCKEGERTSVLSYEEQLAVDMAILDEYLSDNNITAQADASGLRYVVQEPGSGTRPDLNSTVRVAYEGTYMDGSVFDANDDIVFPLRNLIEGWQIGIPLIQEGGAITLYVPSGLAYGTQGIPGAIPGNSNLIFTIQLLEVAN